MAMVGAVMNRTFLIMLTCALWQSGCGARMSDEEIQQYYKDEAAAFGNRASFDLKCPSAELVVVDLSPDTRGVEGCGRSATYVRINYKWIMNSGTQEAHRI